MITNTGKQIIGKYLVGHTDSYASYLAIGSGPMPLGVSDNFGDYSTKTSLDFETLRVPIIAKSILTENGVTRVTLTAELPTEERYEITEVGVYPSANNPIPTGLDSKQILLFNEDEIWIKHPTTGDQINVPLQIGTIQNSNDDITISDKVFFTNSNNGLFENINYPNRLARHERPRFLDRTIFVRGDSSVLATNGTDLSITSGEHIHLPTSPIIFDKNSVNDELRLAFTVINKDGINSSKVPSNVKILIQFATDDASTDYASFIVNLNNGTSTGQWDFTNNRYVVVNKKLSELYKTNNFSWGNVTYIKVYVCVTGTSPATAGDFYVALDALRLENVSSFSDVYGLTAYTVMKTSDKLPIVKSDNGSSFIEFSYVVDVL
jgi:hypothetical protein